MTTMWNVARGLRVVRVSLAVLAVLVGLLWLTSSGPVSASGKCAFDEHPDVGPCDPDKGYSFEGTCYTDDGCYTRIESCCG